MFVRKNHCKLLAMMDDGLIDPEDVAKAALAWMEDSEIADMCRVYEFFLEDEDEDEDEDEEFLVDEE